MNKILIVDDNPSDLMVLKTLLTKIGFEVFEAPEAYKALEMVGQNSFDLIILDWMLPQVSGIDLLKTIRAQKNLKVVPIIFATSKSDARDIKRAIDEGITDYIIKPVDPMILESKISRILKRDDGWKMVKVSEQASVNTFLKLKTQITAISEIALEFTSVYALPELEIIVIESDLLKGMGIAECQIRIQESKQTDDGFKNLGIFLGLKELDMKAIRLYVQTGKTEK